MDTFWLMFWGYPLLVTALGILKFAFCCWLIKKTVQWLTSG